MSIPLPEAVALFFQASNGIDTSTLKDCMDENAIVHDEGRTHEGPAAIEAWLQEAQRKYAYHAEPSSIVPNDNGVTVRATVSGNFPGSPVQLDHVFQLSKGKITSLEIHA